MLKRRTATTRFILHGLDESLSAQLQHAAGKAGHSFYSAKSTAECVAMAERLRPGVIFCSAEASRYLNVIDAFRRKGLGVPVVVVSRLPEISQWLDALEAGAADYCAAPFEHPQISWTIQTAMLTAQAAHA